MIRHHDALTGLANRIGLDAFLVHAQALTSGSRICRWGFYIWIWTVLSKSRYLRTSNDQVLIESAKRLKHCVRTEEFVARIGGDEFVIGLL